MTEQVINNLKNFLKESKYLLNTKAKQMQYKISCAEYTKMLQIIFDDPEFEISDFEGDIDDETIEKYEKIANITIEFDFTKIAIKKSKSNYTLKIDR
jgi:hypothetical protein